MRAFTESTVKGATLTCFGELGHAIGHGPHMAPGEPTAEQESFSDVVLMGRLSGVSSIGITENLAQRAD